MEFYTAYKRKFCVLRMSGTSLTDDEKAELNKALTELTESETHVAIDLASLEYANSRILGQFLIAFKALEKKQGKFVLVAPQRPILDLLRITGLDKILPIFENENMLEIED